MKPDQEGWGGAIGVWRGLSGAIQVQLASSETQPSAKAEAALHRALRRAPLPHVSAECRAKKLRCEDVAEQDRPTSGGAEEGVAAECGGYLTKLAGTSRFSEGGDAMQVSTAALPASLHRRPVPKQQRRGDWGRADLSYCDKKTTFSKPQLESLHVSRVNDISSWTTSKLT